MPVQLPLNENDLNQDPSSLDLAKEYASIAWEKTKEINLKYLYPTFLILLKPLNVLNHRLSRILIMKIPLMYAINIMFFIALLLKYIPYYSKIYAIAGLPATLMSNILLFGLADSLAQTLTRLYVRRPSVNSEIAVTNESDPATSLNYSDTNDNNNRFQIFVDYGDDEDDDDVNSQLDNTNALELAQSTLVFDYKRLVGFMGWSCIISFPQFFWYKILNGLYNDDPKFITVLERVLADQLFYSPLSLAAFFYYSSIVIENGDLTTFEKKIKKVYLGTLAANYCLWPTVQFVNFLVMPKQFQVPFSSSVGVLWNCFLSIRNAQSSST